MDGFNTDFENNKDSNEIPKAENFEEMPPLRDNPSGQEPHTKGSYEEPPHEEPPFREPPYREAPRREAPPKGDSNAFGIASLCFGIGSIVFFCCCSPIFSIVSIVMGILQLTRGKDKTMAIIGIVLSGVSILIFIVFWIIAFSSPVFINEVQTQYPDMIYDFGNEFF